MNIHELRMRLQSLTDRRPKQRCNLPQLKVSLMNMNERLQPHLENTVASLSLALLHCGYVYDLFMCKGELQFRV